MDDSEEGRQVESHASGKMRLEGIDASHGTVVVGGNGRGGGLTFSTSWVACWRSGPLVAIVDSIIIIRKGVSRTSSINFRLRFELGGVFGNDIKREGVEKTLGRNHG